MFLKTVLKGLLKKLPIAITKNQQYDSQTKQVIRRVCTAGSGCIDIGAHKGEVLDIMLKYAPNGTHFAFEPIPALYEGLVNKYAGRSNCNIYHYALSNVSGTTSFNYVISNPAYSGLVKRKYDRKDEVDTVIEVKTALLDDVLPPDYKPALIKIDVEGGELLVLEGAKNLIQNHRPTIIFEHGLGASDFYGATPEKLYDFFASANMAIATMKQWLHARPAFSKEAFCACYYKQQEFYFIAYAA